MPRLHTMGRALPWLPLFGATTALVWFWSADATRPGQGQPPDERAREQAEAELALDGPLSLLVDFRDDLDEAALAANAYVEEPISKFSQDDRLYRVRFADRAARDRALRELRGNADVESVDLDLPAQIPPMPGVDFAPLAPPRPTAPDCTEDRAGAATRGFPDDPCFRYQWHLRQIGLPAPWKSQRGKGAVVAVIDTGVSRVPDLAGITFVPGYNFVGNNDRADDDHGHGTHVAGTIAQATHNGFGVSGIAFEASIMPLKVLSASGSGSMAAIAQAIRFAADHGAHIINMSLGGPFPVSAIGNAVKYAHGKGVLVVAAAGNDGRGKVGYPARYPHVVAVAATQFDEATTFYSNWGPQIDIAAPGGNVRIDQNGDGMPDGVLQNTVVPGNTSRTDYLFFMGTSMASPHVAGVAALLYGAGINQPDRVEELLINSARRPKAGGKSGAAPPGRFDDHYGAGIVDAERALAAARTARDGGALALAATLGFGLVAGRRRRGRAGTLRSRAAFAAALLIGASGLGGLSLLGLDAGSLPMLGWAATGAPLALAGFVDPVATGNPILLSALLPVALVGVFFGLRSARPWLAGFALGVAGLLASLAIGNVLHVAWLPDLLDRAWLFGNAVVCALVGALALRER